MRINLRTGIAEKAAPGETVVPPMVAQPVLVVFRRLQAAARQAEQGHLAQLIEIGDAMRRPGLAHGLSQVRRTFARLLVQRELGVHRPASAASAP